MWKRAPQGGGSTDALRPYLKIHARPGMAGCLRCSPRPQCAAHSPPPVAEAAVLEYSLPSKTVNFAEAGRR